MKEAMEGVKRFTNQAAQAGEGNLWDGDRPLTWGLYEQFNKWFMAEGNEDGIFAAAFSKLTCNLACRGNSTSQVCTKHMKWVDDCLEIRFAHAKDQQRGDNSIKKLPRHCYANPLNAASDLPSTLLHYFAMNPTVIARPEEALFPGAIKAQSQRFFEIVNKIKKKHKTIIERDFGFDIQDIGVHSWRKCAHSKLNTGSTAGPSGAAACLRGGHSMGKNRDVYIAQEKASDTYCGRILQGLPEHSPEFAVSYPDFVPIDLEQSLERGVSETELAERQKVVDHQVTIALQSIFGLENLQAFPTIQRLLRIGLASHLLHLESYSKPIYPSDPRPILPPSAKIRMSPLFTNPAILALKQHVAIARAVENGPVMPAMAADLASLRAPSIQSTASADADGNNATNARSMACLHRQYNHPDGKSCRVPPSWVLPKISFQAIYQYWHHCGDEANNIPPMKYVTKLDVDYLGKGGSTRLYELRKLMNMVDKAAAESGHTPEQHTSLAEANTCIFHGEKAILDIVPANTPQGRARVVAMMKWTTVVKYTHKKRGGETE
ncbi:hypothetical protein ACHAXN_010960 [Cyclotella atomus]